MPMPNDTSSTRPSPVPIPLIVGPTAGGKTGLSIALARALGQRSVQAEVISADSMQVFTQMDIGTAKPTVEERAGVVHHLLDVAEPEEPFSVQRWLDLAEPLVEGLRAKGTVPIVVGGTHLYAKAFLEGLFEGPKADEALRAQLSAMDPHERRAELERVDPEAAQRIHFNDERRTVRALEVYRLTGVSISEHQKQWDSGGHREGVVLIGLNWPAEAVNRRINARVKLMVEQGLVDEVRQLWETGRLGHQAREAVGYKQLVDAFEGRCSLNDGIEKVKIESRRLAKNQRTWLRRLRATPGSIWLDAENTTADEMAQSVVQKVFKVE